MIATTIGWLFIVFGTLWICGCWLFGHSSESFRPWYDMPVEVLWAIPALLVGVGFVAH